MNVDLVIFQVIVSHVSQDTLYKMEDVLFQQEEEVEMVEQVNVSKMNML